MNDKELLMMAARAAGEIGEYVEDYSPGDYYADQFYQGNECGILIGSVGCRHVWNPLTDDGDALRLAVKMRLKIDIRAVCVTVEPYIFNQNAETTFEFFSDDESLRSAATRRAIVRAAAEIGRKL